ncbi:MAG: Ig-like domain-containing protein [Mycobacterium sp.]|nr:Ig-like domain-containing protein [Mycobacterium sp.]
MPAVSAGARRGIFGNLATLFNNRTPTLAPTQTAQSPTGVVTGLLNPVDPDSPALTYEITRDPAHGSVVVSPDRGWAYTPEPAFARAGGIDSFQVAVSDAGSGFHLHGLLGLLGLFSFGAARDSGHTSSSTVAVTVIAVGPPNNPPSGSASVGNPDPATGLVSGSVLATDPDGDALTYTAPATTPKGAVSINPGTGAFTFAPTAAARQLAAAPDATPADLQDSFAVTVSDGYGGSAAVAVTVEISPSAIPATPLPAFPGAEGFGAFATGGRGGRVIYVTNLNADGPGSLQWAIDQSGPKYILFKVSGVIDASIHLTNGDVTIAGQTSPGGVTIRGFVTDESPYQDQAVRAPEDFAENWILQHVRLRPGLDGPSDDGLRIRYTRNAIVDHVSVGNATDEAIEISYSHDITVQNTLIAETLGGNAEYGGVLISYSNPAHGFALDNVSLHHNVFNRIWGRLPQGSRESVAAAGSFMNLEVSNNYYWDPRFFMAIGAEMFSLTDPSGRPYPIYWRMNAVNNYFRTASGFPFGMFDDQIMRTPINELYFIGNMMNLYPTRSDYELFYCCNNYPDLSPSEVSDLVAAQLAQKRATRHPFPTITYTPTDQLRTFLLNSAGAWPRDPMDIRLMRSIATNTIATAPIDRNPAGDALQPAYSGAAPAAPVDSDGDGMPDTWETANGLDPAVPNPNGTGLSALGYTDLEVYLQELSASRITGWSGPVAS